MTDHCFLDGGVAQLGEHLLCKQGVVGSIPISSTSLGGGKAEGRAKREAFSSDLWIGTEKVRWFFNKTEEVKRLARRSGIARRA